MCSKGNLALFQESPEGLYSKKGSALRNKLRPPSSKSLSYSLIGPGHRSRRFEAGLSRLV